MASKVLERVPKDLLSVAGVPKGVGTVTKSVVSFSPSVLFGCLEYDDARSATFGLWARSPRKSQDIQAYVRTAVPNRLSALRLAPVLQAC